MDEYRVGVVAVYAAKASSRRQLVMITARGNGEWILPTGKHEAFFSDRRVARAEAFEEAGVRGRKLRKLRSRLRVKNYRGKRDYALKLYRLEVDKLLDDWPESKQRKRCLVNADELGRFIQDRDLRDLLIAQLR